MPLPISLSSVNHRVTFIIPFTARSERLFFLPHLLARWAGPISIAFFLSPSELSSFTHHVQTANYPSRLSLVLYVHSESSSKDCVMKVVRQRRGGSKLSCVQSSVYPINRLRNLAIGNVRTTHFVVFDMDMWPACR